MSLVHVFFHYHRRTTPKSSASAVLTPPFPSTINPLDQQPLNLILNSPNLRLELTGLITRNTGGDDAPAHAAGTAEGDLARDEDVGDVFVLAEQRKVQQDLERLGVGGHDDELADSAVQRLGGLVGALLELAVVRRLLDYVQDLLRERRVGEGEGCGSNVSLDARAMGWGIYPWG